MKSEESRIMKLFFFFLNCFLIEIQQILLSLYLPTLSLFASRASFKGRDNSVEGGALPDDDSTSSMREKKTPKGIRYDQGYVNYPN